MDTIKLENKNNVKIIAHRGLSGIETENTCSSFVAAGNRSYYGIECDVHVTSDGKYVVVHDDNTNRVSGQNIDIEKTPFDDIRNIVLYNKYRMSLTDNNDLKTNRKDLIIPSMSEYVEICKKYNKMCIIELKNAMEEKHIVNIIDEIKKLDYLNNVVFISFSYENMVILRKLLPQQPLEFLTCEWNDDIFNKIKEQKMDLDMNYLKLTKEIVEQVHSIGQKVNCWTCDTKDEAEKLMEFGVDYITSNILE